MSQKLRPLPDGDLEYVVIHTSASPQKYTWEWLRWYFIKVLKWTVEGYHVVIEETGFTKRLVPHGYQSNGVRAFRGKDIYIHNGNSVHICWEGGIDEKGNGTDNRTEAQKAQLLQVVAWYVRQYPHIKILGHNQVAQKLCPCFNVVEWAKTADFDEKNIYPTDNYHVLKWHFRPHGSKQKATT